MYSNLRQIGLYIEVSQQEVADVDFFFTRSILWILLR